MFAKSEILELLAARSFREPLGQPAAAKNAVKPLIGALFHPDESIGWRAVEALGVVAETLVGLDLEFLKGRIRRLFWTTNDESGSICPRAPEAIAEIVRADAGLAREFGPPLAELLNQSPYERGAAWGAARLVAAGGGAFLAGAAEAFRAAAASPDPYLAAFALISLAGVDRAGYHDYVETVAKDERELIYYNIERGEFVPSTVRELVEKAGGRQ